MFRFEFLQTTMSEETIPTVKDISSVVDSLKKDVASRHCVSIEVHSYCFFTSFSNIVV